MSDSSLFKPRTSTGGIGQKAMDKGQFANAPAYPETSGFSGPSKIMDGKTAGVVQKTPTAKGGKV